VASPDVKHGDDRILLVARAGARWTLPGGKIKRDEAPESKPGGAFRAVV